MRSGAMPMPVSATTRARSAPRRSAATVIVPPFGVNFTALESRSSRIWRRRCTSARICGRPVAISLRSVTPTSAARDEDMATAPAINSPRSTSVILQDEQAGIDLRQVVHIGDELEQMSAGTVDIPDVAALLGGERTAEIAVEEFGESDDGVELGAQLVAHGRQELRFGAIAGIRDLEGGGEVRGLRLEAALGLLEFGQGGAQPLRFEGRWGAAREKSEGSEGGEQADDARQDDETPIAILGNAGESVQHARDF